MFLSGTAATEISLVQAAVLAVVQGVTEFLPISSSAHLSLAPWLLGWPDQGLAFDIALHLGTLASVVVFFYRDWLQLFAQAFGVRFRGDDDLARSPRMLWLLAAASIPLGVVGLLLKSQAETTFRSPFVSGTMLIVGSLILAAAEWFGSRTKPIGSLSTVDGLWIGAAQALAIVPGVSRSGITIAAGMFRQLDRAAAARFSFLLSTPAVAAAGAKSTWDLVQAGGIPPGLWPPFLVGVALSALTGWFVIAFLLRYLARYSLKAFIYYRLFFGIIVIALAIVRAGRG